MLLEIQHGKPYWSGLHAWTDLHAGGILFGYVYSECLIFCSDKTVTQSFKVFDTFAQMDRESEKLADEQNVGLYKVNSRGLIECDFKNKHYTGTICKNNKPRVLAFDVYFKEIAVPSCSRVYTLTEHA